MSAIYSLSWESWLAYVAFIEGNFLQCGPQYIAVSGSTIPLLVRIMWALPMHYPGHFPHCTQEIIIMDFLIEKLLLIAYLLPCYLPNLYPCIFANPIPTPLLGYLPTLIPITLFTYLKIIMDFLLKLHYYILGISWEMTWVMHGKCPHYSD